MGDDDNIKSSSEEKTPYLGIPIQLVPGHIKKYWQMWKNDEIPEQRKSYYKHMFKKYGFLPSLKKKSFATEEEKKNHKKEIQAKAYARWKTNQHAVLQKYAAQSSHS
jgi:hypothetical protein